MSPLLIALSLAAADQTPRQAVPPASYEVPADNSASGGQPLGYLTAAQLAQRCKDNAAGSISYCYAYVTGVHDTMRAYEIWLGQREFCVPAKTSQAELRQAFISYLTAYPTNATGQASSVIAVALRETYPCGAAAAKAPPRLP